MPDIGSAKTEWNTPDTSEEAVSETVHVSRGELTAPEVLEILDRGGRIVIDVDVCEESRQATVRETDGTYYCDTATKLLRHETADELLTCLAHHRLRPDHHRRQITHPVAARSAFSSAPPASGRIQCSQLPYTA